jgi:hypothetical protein
MFYPRGIGHQCRHAGVALLRRPFDPAEEDRLAILLLHVSLVLLDGTRAWSDDAGETIVLVRHGEKDKGSVSLTAGVLAPQADHVATALSGEEQ